MSQISGASKGKAGALIYSSPAALLWRRSFVDTFDRQEVGDDWETIRPSAWSIADGRLRFKLPSYEYGSWVNTSLRHIPSGVSGSQRVALYVPEGLHRSGMAAVSLRHRIQNGDPHFLLAGIRFSRDENGDTIQDSVIIEAHVIKGGAVQTIGKDTHVFQSGPSSEIQDVRPPLKVHFLVTKFDDYGGSFVHVLIQRTDTGEAMFEKGFTTNNLHAEGQTGVNSWQNDGLAPEVFFDRVDIYEEVRVPQVLALKGNADGRAIVKGKAETSELFPDPTGLVSYRISRLRIRTEWGQVTGATLYHIYRREYNKGQPWAQVGTATGLIYTDSAVERGKKYEYRVRATDGQGISAGAQSDPVAVPLFVLFMIGDSNLEFGAMGKTTAARGYLSNIGGVNPDLMPDSPYLLSGKVAYLIEKLETVNHGVSGTQASDGTYYGIPNALEAVDGTVRFNAEVLGEGYLWSANNIARANAMTPGVDDFCYYSFGTNDIQNGRSVSQIIGDIKNAINRWKGAGQDPKRMIVATVPPYSSAEIPALNAAIRGLETSEGVTVLESVGLVSDDDGLTWRNSDYHKDGVHYSEQSLDLIAGEIAATIHRILTANAIGEAEGAAAVLGALRITGFAEARGSSYGVATIAGAAQMGVRLRPDPIVSVASVFAKIEGFMQFSPMPIRGNADVFGLAIQIGAAEIEGRASGTATTIGFLYLEPMILERALSEFLAANKAVKAVFAPPVYYWDVAPPSAKTPYLVLQAVSGYEGTLWGGERDITKLRIQITTWAKTRFEANYIREKIIRPNVEGKIIAEAFVGVASRADLVDNSLNPKLHGAVLDVILSQGQYTRNRTKGKH